MLVVVEELPDDVNQQTLMADALQPSERPTRIAGLRDHFYEDTVVLRIAGKAGDVDPVAVVISSDQKTICGVESPRVRRAHYEPHHFDDVALAKRNRLDRSVFFRPGDLDDVVKDLSAIHCESLWTFDFRLETLEVV